MGARLLFNHDPQTGMTEWFDEVDDNTFMIVTEQDCSAFIEHNKRLQNEPLNKRGEMWRVGTIPNVIAMKWKTEEGLDIFDPNAAKDVDKKLNDPEWKWLRNSEFRL